MKYRLLTTITLVVILAFAALGISKRQTYTDLRNEENYLEQVQVAELPEKLVSAQCEWMNQELPNAPFILRVEVMEDVEYLFGTSRQKICVQEAYAGRDLNVGDEIYLTGQCLLNVRDDLKTVECGFLNIPRVGFEYLIFAEERVDALSELIPVYRLYGDYFIAPIFCYKDFPHTITPTIGETTYIPYKGVKDNEFFAETENGFQIWDDLKKRILTAYPASN